MSNPYRAPKAGQAANVRPQFSIAVLLFTTSLFATAFACVRVFGVIGWVYAFYACVFAWWAASASGSPSLHPISTRRWTPVEAATVVAICLILYGLITPAVQYEGRQRPPLPVSTVPPSNAPATTDSNASGDGR